MAPKTRLVGMRFHPTDEELVNHYLKRKHMKLADQEACIIPDIDIYSHDPHNLNKVYDEISDEKSDGNYCYFFCPRDSTKNGYPKRKTEDGFWKETSEKQVVQDEATEEVMWIKRYFVYHQGPQRSSSKTDWVMHEYCLGGSRPGDDTSSDKAAFALCHIKRKKKKNKQVKQRRTNTQAKSSGAQQGSSFAQTAADQLLEIPGAEEESMPRLPQTVADQQLKIPEAKEESISIQATIESEITTESEPTKQSVNDKRSDEQQSENNSMANNYDTEFGDFITDTDFGDYITDADLFNQEELDLEDNWAAVY